MAPHYSSSVVPPTLSATESCFASQTSFRFSSMSPRLEDSPLPLASKRSDHFIDDISDIDDSDSDDDLSPILDAMITIPIPQNSVDVKNLLTQAKAKRKTAINKCKLADANFRDAMSKARLCRIRAQQAKHVLDATKVYLHHVNWTIQRSRDVRKPSPQVMTVSDSGQDGTKVNHFVNIPGGSIAITLD